MKKKDKRRILDGFSYVKMEDYLMSNYSLNLIEIVICIEKYTKIEDRTDKKEKVSLNTLLKKIKTIEYARDIYLYEDIIENGKIEKKSKDNPKKYMDIIQEEYLEVQKNDDEFIAFCLKYKIFGIDAILQAIEKIKLLSQIEQIGFKLELENTNRFRRDEDRNLTVCINHQPWVEINHEKVKILIEENVLINKKMVELINERGSSGMHMYNSEIDKMLYLKHHYSKNKLNIDILKIEANFSRYFQTRKIQYFAPLRFYPKRKDLIQLKEEDNRAVPKKEVKIGKIKFYWLLVYNYLLYKYINKKDRNIYINLMVVIPKFKSILLKMPMMIDIFNHIPFINIKYKDTSTAKNIWNELIQSKFGIEKLNKWLSDDKKLKSHYKVKIVENKKWNELKFIDLRNNIEVTPRDMGLGISQVLPILVASQNFQDTTLFLEQPELHLHPAVQCELADEFIKSAKENGNKFYIETHSEHLLLRVMKRLRHSSEGKLKEDDPLYLTPEDICLLYVDNNGKSTYLKELELDKDGSLLDAWPNGFFEEGYKERFE